MRKIRRNPSRVSPTVAATGAALALLLLAGCAPEPLPHWDAPVREANSGVRLVSLTTDPDGDDTELEAEPQQAVPLKLTPDPKTLESVLAQLAHMRLRNDTVHVAARVSLVPGVPAANEIITAEIREAIAASGGAYAPQVFGEDAHLAERGCVSGSSTWDAADVLNTPATGPNGGQGTAVVCDLLGAYGDTLVLALRTVTGSSEAVSHDRTRTLYIDVVTGEVSQGAQQWRQAAAPQLWEFTVSELRREAGALSSAATAPPSEMQLSLAAAALDTARQATDGGLIVSFSPELTAPELEGLGVAPLTEPISVAVTPEQVWEWATDHGRALISGSTKPFVGLTAGWASVPVDCTLFPCVAVTYDDGPGPFTPRLIGALSEQRGLATFYMLGNAAAGNPGTVQAVSDAGHQLGSHTMSHPDLTQLPLPEAKAQVLNAAQVLRDISGQAVGTYRPPYGAISDALVAEVGMPAILWSIDTNDWRKPGVDALVERSVPVAKPGSIILFHDVHEDTVSAAGRVFSGLHNRGFVTVTVDQLFGGSAPNGVVRAR